MGKYAAAIFDLDGTLLDSMKVWERVDRAFLLRRGLPVPEDYTETVASMSFEEAARYTVERFGLTEPPQALVREWDGRVAEEYAHHIGLKPGVRECLRFLAARGLKFGVATALPERLYSPALQNNGVYGDFAAFASVTETTRGKGFPDVYLLCARRLGVLPGGCLVFEDVLPGLRGAKAAGMDAVGVYDDSTRLREKEALSVADGYLRSFLEMKDSDFCRKFL